MKGCFYSAKLFLNEHSFFTKKEKVNMSDFNDWKGETIKLVVLVKWKDVH